MPFNSRRRKHQSRGDQLQNDILQTKLDMQQARLRQIEQETTSDDDMTFSQWSERCPAPTAAERDALIEKVSKMHSHMAERVFNDRIDELMAEARAEERAAHNEWLLQFVGDYP